MTKLCRSSCAPYFSKEFDCHPTVQANKEAIILDSFLSYFSQQGQSPNFFSLPRILIFFYFVSIITATTRVRATTISYLDYGDIILIISVLSV